MCSLCKILLDLLCADEWFSHDVRELLIWLSYVDVSASDKDSVVKCAMDRSAADDDSDDAEVFTSQLQTPTDVLSRPVGCSTAQQQYDCQAGPSSSNVPVWLECLPVRVTEQPTDGDMHAATDFISSFHRGKKSALHPNFQTQVYNFLERPTGWKCFLYHFSV